MTQKRCYILVDGSNFYFKLKYLKLHYLLDFDFSRFIKMLVGKNKFAECIYYIGKVRTDGTEKTQVLFNNQRKLFAHLKLHKVQYSLGYLLKSDDKFHEKGVDYNYPHISDSMLRYFLHYGQQQNQEGTFSLL